MSLMTMLNAAQGGGLFAAVGASLGLSESDTRQALGALCPAIAEKLHDKAAADDDTYETLLDLLDDNGGAASLEDAEALTGAEAISDGNAMLDEIYGSRQAAMAALGPLAAPVGDAQAAKLAAVSATAVLTALAQSQTAQPLAGAQQAVGGPGGLLGTIAEALVKGLVQGATRSLAPRRRRRRRSYSTHWGPRRKRRTTRRRKRRTPLEEIFGAILGSRR